MDYFDIIKLERSVDREQTPLSPANSRSLKIVLLMVYYDRARFSLIQLFWGTLDSYSTDDPTSKTSKCWCFLKSLHQFFSIFSNFYLYFWGLGAKAGAQNQFFSTDMKLGPQNECYIKFWRFYDQTQKCQNFDLSGARGGQTGAPKQNFSKYKIKAPKSI